MLLAIAAAPVAQADDDDTAYLVAIQSVSVPSNSPAMATTYGRGELTSADGHGQNRPVAVRKPHTVALPSTTRILQDVRCIFVIPDRIDRVQTLQAESRPR
jgi:hypothetical protein